MNEIVRSIEHNKQNEVCQTKTMTIAQVVFGGQNVYDVPGRYSCNPAIVKEIADVRDWLIHMTISQPELARKQGRKQYSTIDYIMKLNAWLRD